MVSSSDLTNLLRQCLEGYAQAVQVFATDASGNVESLAQDAVQMGHWARLIGLDSGNLDSQLSRFKPYLYEELSLLQRSLTSSMLSTSAGAPAGETEARSQILCGWIDDILISGTYGCNHDASLNCISPTSILPPKTLDQLSTLSRGVHKALLRLLSSSQKTTFDRTMQHWAEGIISGDNLAAVMMLRHRPTTCAEAINSIDLGAEHKLHSCKEETELPARLLRTLELCSEELRWSIPLDQEPEILQDLSRSHFVGRFRGDIVFVEKRQNLDWMAEGAAAIELFLRIDSLAANLAKRPKPASFCALDLVGYFSDRKKREYGFVYEWPWNLGPAWDQRYRPRTLNEFIAESEDDAVNIGPSLTRRLEMAQTVATCVKMFHLFGWLHKSLNSHNVLLFPKPPSDPPLAGIQDQLFLVGFEYSRQYGPNYATEPITKLGDYDIYRHPEVTGFEQRSHTALKINIFERRHDIYALGVLLAEIGIWNRVEVMQNVMSPSGTDDHWSSSPAKPVPTPHEFRDWIVRGGQGSVEALLRFSSGEKYAQATMGCLREEVEDGEEYFSHLYTKVLEPLNYCSV